MNILILSSHAEPNQSALQLVNWEMWNHQHAYSRNAGPYKISTKMRELGHRVEIADFIVYWPESAIKQYLDERIPYVDILGWSSQFFFDFGFYKKWTAYIKQIKPNIIFIAGGPKVTNLLNFTESRYLIAGYAEDAIEDVLNHIEKKPNKLKFKILDGRYYVDCLEFYPMTTLPSMEIIYHPSDYIAPSETLTIGTSRGCIFKCSFCTYPYIGKNKHDFNRQGANTYYQEFMRNYQQWGVTRYYLSDETANDNIDKLLDIEEASQKLPFKLEFTGFVRLDLMARQKEHWAVYKNIGFTNWHFGIESFNPVALKAMTKGFSPQIQQQTLLELREYFGSDALIYASFIVGAPYDTPESFEQLTIEWLRTDGKDALDGKTFFPLNIHRETPYAVGSELSRNYQNYGYHDMTADEIATEMSLDSTITQELVDETKRYNVLWATDKWNVFSVERYSKQYRNEICWPNNLGPWTRAKIVSVGVPSEDVNKLRIPNNHSLFRAFEERLPKVLNTYISNKLSKNWYLTN
jgi:radical SAM superfamily enzyme YgiQ (UPF0313 family)